MYFVDREKIEEKLQFMEQQIQLLKDHPQWDTKLEIAAFERISHTIIESIIDVGNAMIDGFIMRDPGSYEDIIDILLDEKVITEDMSKNLLKVIFYRKILVQQYTSINHKDLVHDVSKSIQSLLQFPPRVRDYLTNELGPVTAFKN